MHLECDDYKSDLMVIEPDSTNYIQWRMCPPGRCMFFFTIEGKQVISKKYPIIKIKLKTKAFFNANLLGDLR